MATTTYNPIASSPAAWILFDSQAYAGDASNRNGSTATARAARSNGKPIEVLLWAAVPPIPSRVYVHCPHLEAGEVFLEPPRIVYTADCFILLRVSIGCSRTYRPRGFSQEMNDFFIYQPAGPKAPSLKMLKNPHPFLFQDDEVALLPRGDHFTVAALSASTGNTFDLHLFKSEDWTWSTKVVVVDKPQEPFPLPISNKTCRIFEHITSMVITIGGECGTIGWVDLWRGILLCDLLTENHNLRDVPMPLVQPERLANHGDGIECCPKPYRGIAVVGSFLKVVELGVSGNRLPNNDPETNLPNFRIHDWTLTTYSKSKTAITYSWHDWVIDCTVKASDIEINEAARSGLLRSGLLCKPQNSEAAEQNLQNLDTCQPILSLDDEGIVYLVTRLKFLHPKAWVLAVDTRNNRVEAMAKIAPQRSKDLSLTYRASTISSYMDASMPGTDCKRCLGNQQQQADDGESTAASRLSSKD